MSPEKQIEMWVKGESIHNEERDECCPDFSCCQPDLLVPETERLRFVKANLEKREGVKSQMLMTFLSRLMKHQKLNVYVIG